MLRGGGDISSPYQDFRVIEVRDIEGNTLYESNLFKKNK